jgi:hypothetical protein
MTWTDFGGIAQCDKFPKDRGVYLAVFKGTPHRIIEVGTALNADGFQRRFKKKKGDWEGGGSFIFKASLADDIYKFMTLASYQTRTSYQSLVDTLCALGHLWVPATPRCTDWKLDHWKDTLDLIEIYGCVTETEEDALVLESRLQIALGQLYRLGYCSRKLSGDLRQNWLGRQERRGKLRGGEFVAPMTFEKSDLRSLRLADEIGRVFIESRNRGLVQQYFLSVDDPFCSF